MASPFSASDLPKSLQVPVTQPSSVKPMTEEQLRLFCANPDLRDVVRTQIKTFNLPFLINDNGQLVDAIKGTELHLKRFITVDPAVMEMKSTCMRLAKCQDEILIHGETGTGKELIARAMIGDRQETGGKFIAVNCAGLPNELIESELFGHKKGSFTGASEDKKGMLSMANDGVIFLDEIGELPLLMQGKLLRAIQEMKVRRVGSNEEIDINCKFVFATNKDIPRMVREGTFRQDLYARMSTFEVWISPLRQRICDIIPIIGNMPKGKDFLQHCVGLDIDPKHQLDLQHNVRSLHQYVRRFAVLGSVKVIP